MIIAGCGYSGRRLAHRLVAAGHDVTCLTSSANSRAALENDGLTATSWNLDGDDAPPPLPDHCPVAYLVPPSTQDDTDRRLARFLAGFPGCPSRLVYASTTGVYGDRGGALVDETAPPTPDSDRARRRVDAERQVMAWGAAHARPTLILRRPGIYGPDRLQLATLESGRALLHPEEAGPGNRIHVDDLVRCLDAALHSRSPVRVLNVGDGDYASNTRFVTEVAQQLRRPAPPRAGRAEIKAAASARRWSFMRESRRVDASRLRRTLGIAPQFASHRDGIAASLREMGLVR